MKHIPYPMRAQPLWWFILFWICFANEWVNVNFQVELLGLSPGLSSDYRYLALPSVVHCRLVTSVIWWPLSSCHSLVPGLPQWAFYILGRSLPCCWVKDFFNSFPLSILLYWQHTSFFPLSLGLNSWSSCLCLPRAKIAYMHHHPWLNLCIVWQLPSRCISPLVLNLKSQFKLKLLNWRKG